MSSRTLQLLATVVLALCSASCMTYREAALDSVEVGDLVRVTDLEGNQHLFEVTEVNAETIAGGEIRIGAGEIRTLEEGHRSVMPVLVGTGKILFAVIYLAALTFPFWFLFVK